jgi:hypothetical protein
MRTDPRPWPFHPAKGLPVFLATLLAGFTVACSSGSSEPQPDPSVPTTLVAVEGTNLEAPGGTVLPEGPTVEVKDQFGDPMVGVVVSFQVLAGGGSAPVPSRATDIRGQVRVPWILGREAGSVQRLQASTGPLSVVFEAQATAAIPGESYLGRNAYTEYLPGSLPLVLSAPHGGDLTPAEIPDRTYGTTVTDRNTRQLALQIREALRIHTGSYPHIIISHLNRTKLDPNREIVEAAQGDPEAERAWWEFQTFIDEAERIVEEEFGEGFYIDLHGHGHAIDRLELGYLLSSGDLSNSDEVLSDVAFAEKSSLKALATKPGVVFSDLIRGPLSLGSLMELEGFPSVPSQLQPHPGNDPYFTGGYNTWRHGSRDEGTVSGVQIECNYPGVRDTEANRQAFAEALGRVLTIFFPAHFGMPFASSPSLSSPATRSPAPSSS